MARSPVRSLKRKTDRQAPYQRLLIVTEGEKTEPGYFKEIRATYRLHTSHTCICPSDFGTDPDSVVRYAEHVFRNGLDNGHGRQLAGPHAFDRIYAVFDRDDHHTYQKALQKAASLDGKLKNDNRQTVRFLAIPSNPCFEIWLLLHCQEQRSWLHRKDVFKCLRQHWGTYDKGETGLFARTSPQLVTATARACRLKETSSPYSDECPYTDVVDLVDTLVHLKS